jgi:hypothetical protein
LHWFGDRWRVPAHGAATPLHHYSYKAIEKRDGRCRLIETPKSRLRVLQRKVLTGLLDRIPVHDAVHGFRRSRNIVTFVAPHVAKAVVIRFDLTDFFASVHAGRVYSAIHALGYPQAVVRALADRFSLRVAAIAIEEGFSVNLRKTRVMRESVRRQYTGHVDPEGRCIPVYRTR